MDRMSTPLRADLHCHSTISDGTLTPEPITLPERVAHLMLAMASDAGFKPLDGIASAPLLAEDGSLRVADGYDPLTRMWCEHMPEVEVPPAPTRQQRPGRRCHR